VLIDSKIYLRKDLELSARRPPPYDYIQLVRVAVQCQVEVEAPFPLNLATARCWRLQRLHILSGAPVLNKNDRRALAGIDLTESSPTQAFVHILLGNHVLIRRKALPPTRRCLIPLPNSIVHKKPSRRVYCQSFRRKDIETARSRRKCHCQQPAVQ
jgi:hypothetical protein